MNTKKFVCMVTAASLFVLPLSGCSLFGGKDKAAIEEVATSYIDYIKSGKLNKSAALVADEEDFFQENAFPAQQEDLLSVVLPASEYEVQNIEVNKTSASAEIVFTIPDLDSIADEGYSFTEFLEAVDDIDETVEETVEFDFTKDGDEWLIEGDSTEDFFNFLSGIGADLEFGLSESGALEAVDTFMSYLAQGDVDGVLSMSPEGADIFDSYDEFLEEMGTDSTLYSDLFSSFFSNVEYTSSVVSASEDEVVVSLEGTAPDAQAAMTEAASDHAVMVPIFADYLEAVLAGNYDQNIIVTELIEAVTGSVAQSNQMIPYSTSITVTADEEGNFYCDPSDGFFYDFDFPDIADADELMPEALDLLLEQGRISQSDYNQLLLSMGGSSGDYDVTDVVVIEGDDYYNHDYLVTADSILLNVQTWDYYNTGDTFEYEVEVNGANAISGTYVIPDNSDDIVEILIPVVDPSGPYGSYVVTVYDEGSSSSVLAKIEIVVLEEGAPASGIAPTFGQSMSYANEGDDFYAFHCLDGNGNGYTDSTYPSNRGAVDFYVMTWAYYDVGTEVTADVYLDGELIGSVTGANSRNGTDTFTFSYEPNSLEDGDYVFRIYDVEGNGVLCDAYCTVRTEN